VNGKQQERKKTEINRSHRRKRGRAAEIVLQCCREEENSSWKKLAMEGDTLGSGEN